MQKYWPILLATFVGIAALLFGLHSATGPVDSWTLASRYTARVAFPFFILTYSASALVRLWPGDGTRALLRNRRFWGLSFAAAHTVHFVALTNYLNVLPVSRPVAGLVPGGAVYLVIFAMALTSFPWAYKALGKNWKRLHTAGIHLIWAAFTIAYIGKAMQPDQRGIGMAFAAIALGALGLRIAARRKASRA